MASPKGPTILVPTEMVAVTDRHDAALRAALEERDQRSINSSVWREYPVADDYIVARIVEAALAAADMDLTERDATAVQVVTEYLIHQPEQGEWEWEDHCEGIAGGILAALEAHGYVLAAADAQSVPVAQLRAVIALIGDEDMTPTARRMLESVCGGADENDGAGDVVLCRDGSSVHDFQGQRVCPGCGWAEIFAAPEEDHA